MSHLPSPSSLSFARGCPVSGPGGNVCCDGSRGGNSGTGQSMPGLPGSPLVRLIELWVLSFLWYFREEARLVSSRDQGRPGGDPGETQGRPRGTYKYEEVENKHQVLHAAQTVALHGVRPRKHKDTQFFTWRHSDSHSWSPAQPHPGAPVPTPLERVKIGSLLGQHWVRTAGTLIWNFNSYSLVPWLWSAIVL